MYPNKEPPNDALLRPTQLRQKLRRILLLHLSLESTCSKSAVSSDAPQKCKRSD